MCKNARADRFSQLIVTTDYDVSEWTVPYASTFLVQTFRLLEGHMAKQDQMKGALGNGRPT